MDIKQLNSDDVALFKELIKLFGEVFEDKAYSEAKPSEEYIESFLKDRTHIVLVSLEENKVRGGLVAYELKKFEKERSEIYIYDLAVAKRYQHKGIGTSLIENLKNIAKKRDIKTIFLQADKIDSGAIAFYRKFKAAEKETINFDLEV